MSRKLRGYRYLSSGFRVDNFGGQQYTSHTKSATLSGMLILRRFMVLVMKRIFSFATSQQLIVPGVFILAFGAWQWDTGAWHFRSLQEICRNLWPYCAAFVVFWTWICFSAGNDLNKQLQAEQDRLPSLFSSERERAPRKSVVFPGPCLAVCLSIPGVLSIVTVTYLGLLWVQPWRITLPTPPVPDMTYVPAPVEPQHQISKKRRLLRNQLGAFLTSEVIIKNGCLTPPTQPKSACIQNALNWLSATYTFVKGSMEPSCAARLLAATPTIQNYEGANGDHELNTVVSVLDSRGRMIDEFIRELQ